MTLSDLTLTDPLGSSPLVAAVQWLEGTLLGTIAVTVAIIAVASVGLMMLTGRINLRHGAIVIFGCFILFGAPVIVAGLQSAITGSPETSVAVADPSPPVVIPPSTPSSDPYAGASLRRR
jgi:type IV secretory pathway VirB2 component (pilin)